MLKHIVVGALVLSCTPFAALAASTNSGVEEQVRAYFADTPVMIEIAKCESESKQFNDAGGPLMGGLGKKMMGLFQIHTTVHTKEAQRLGHDITTVMGNMAYARYLYEKEGTVPWVSSSSCWSVAKAALEHGAILPERANFSTAELRETLSVGMTHAQVIVLQRLLNRAGYSPTQSGAGAPGFETNFFGAMTRAAVRKFQCEHGIICEGDEWTTGFGIVGPKTRTLLMNAHSKSIGSSSTSSVPAASSVPTTIAPESTLASTTLTAGDQSYTLEQLNEISRLQSQIAELVALIATLKAAR